MSLRGRGEVKLMLVGEEVTLRPSFLGMEAIEEILGRGLVAEFDTMMKGNIGFKNVAAAIYGGLIGSDHVEEFEVGEGKQKRIIKRPLTYQEVGHRVQATGIQKVMRPAARFLAECIRGQMPAPEAEQEKPAGEAQGADASAQTSGSPSEATTASPSES